MLLLLLRLRLRLWLWLELLWWLEMAGVGMTLVLSLMLGA